MDSFMDPNIAEDEEIRSEIAPNTALHLFQSAAFLSGSIPNNPSSTHPLGTALNLRHAQTIKKQNISIPPILESTLVCPSCGCIWIPGINVTVRLVTYQTHKKYHKTPYGIIVDNEDEIPNETDNEENLLDMDSHPGSHRLSKRARKRREAKMKQKKEKLTTKLHDKLGLDSTYVALRSKSLHQKSKLVAYGCESCGVYHIVESAISNQYPTVSVKAMTNIRSNYSTKASSNTQHSQDFNQGKFSKESQLSNKNSSNLNGLEPSSSTISSVNKQNNSNISIQPSSSSIRKDKPAKSKQKNSLQKLIAKQKESKAQQQAASGLGLLGLMSKK